MPVWSEEREPGTGQALSEIGSILAQRIPTAPDSPRWRTDFYRVASWASVPIVPVALDFSRKRYVIHPPQVMTGDSGQEIAHLQTFFRAEQACKPDRY